MGVNAPFQVATAAKNLYKTQTGLDLDITNSSLGVEILGHAVLYMLEIQESHTGVADCGEKVVDSNRKIWDFISF